MPARLSARLSAIAPSATLAVTNRAKDMKAQGEDVIGFGAGEPDFPTPDYIVEAAVVAARDPKNHRYTATNGLIELREAIAAKALRDSGLEVDPANIVVTNGGKQAVFNTFQALLNPGDEVIIPAPYWTTYPEAVKLAGGVPVEVFAGPEAGYKVTVEQLEAARTDSTQAVLFVSPSNPTGAVYTPEETRAIGEWARDNDIWVITDEIYEHLVYDEAEFTSIAAVTEGLEKVVILNGVAKTYSMTGWRVGWLIGPSDLIKVVSTFQSHSTGNVANVSQRAAIAAVSGTLDEVHTMRESFDRRRKAMVEALNQINGFHCPTPKGAFYAYVDVREALGKTYAGQTPTTSSQLAELILQETGVALVPGEAFGPSGFLRLSYALGDDDLAEGLRRVRDFINSAA
ncbi:pyridoxal phosphate-dependent aminotransferase [Pseudoglutamicibacter albus]|uniref:Aminotransferase n=1 Tax=Pseudoglutamicibacter albus DNF00011 TaxID=1401063 RepID=A0A095ZLN1_9MICC|nr:pyridoxal phosphate-dependent aminotransferase [Pseudoglutamicibacter albus]KGF19522.1 aspartate aminotransferase [Pseudoglutamicibacter albus DNF00011]